MAKIRKILTDLIPKYSFFPLIWAVVFNLAVYWGSKAITGKWHHYNMESAFDSKIPLWSPAVLIYFGCYLFWAVNYILMARQEKKEVCQFFSGDFLSRIICLVIFLILPTTNVRPAVEPDGFWNQIMIFLYTVDAPDNLFPSIHCLISWFCYIGLRGRKDVPAGYRRFSCVMALLVCVSTLLTKQHVIVDVIAGVVLAEFSCWLGKKPAVWQTYEKVVDKINRVIFRRKERLFYIENHF